MTETDRSAPRRATAVQDTKPSIFARLALFYRQVVAELRKVVWPTRNQMLTYTAVVIVFVLFIIALVSIIDLVVGWGTLRLFG